MRLEDLMEVLDESENVTVKEMETGKVLAFYDGKNSIPVELNNREIANVYTLANGINIEVM